MVLNRSSTRPIIGTAQWGLDYGVTNALGRIPDSELVKLIESLREHGLVSLDTASNYGDAEERIREHCWDFQLQSKIQICGKASDQILDDVRLQLSRLGRRSIHCMLAHDWSSLTHEEQKRALETLSHAKSQGLIEQIGISVYDPEELNCLEDFHGEVTAIQFPCSVLDQRFINEVNLGELKSRGVSLQVRSVYLQGLLLSGVPSKPIHNHKDLQKFRDLTDGHPFGAQGICHAFINQIPHIDQMVLGITSVSELHLYLKHRDQTIQDVPWIDYMSTDQELIDPRLWRK